MRKLASGLPYNLAADKAPVLKEAFRVLKPGGRFAVSDVVVRGEAPEWVMQSMEAWTGCIAGALHEDKYNSLLSEAGFTDVGIEVTRSYSGNDVTGEESCCAPANPQGEDLKMADGLFVSAFIRATKPLA